MKALKLPDAVVMCQVIALLMLQHDATPPWSRGACSVFQRMHAQWPMSVQ